MADAHDERLVQWVASVEMIDSEIDALREMRRERMAEAKAWGYHLAILRQVLARRKMSPSDRGEADALLEAYEAALGGEAPAVPLRADAHSLAVDLLAAQIEGIADPEKAAALVDHVLALLDIRAEIAVLRGQESNRKKLAADEHFDAKQLALVVRWYEKCAKHGPDAMKAGEAVFDLYRGTVDERGGPVRQQGAPTADEKLAALFATPAPKAPTQKQKAVSDAVAAAQASLRKRGG